MKNFDSTNLGKLCLKHISGHEMVVIREPYIPYIPVNWNGVLILAESQNLSKTNEDYVNKLKNMDQKGKFRRLNNPENIGIQPWDDGTLKLAVESIFPNKSLDSYSISNAVPWSLIDENGNNRSPDEELIHDAVYFWKEILRIMEPDIIITCGKIAKQVISKCWEGKLLDLWSPSPSLLSRVSGMFNQSDLLVRFPEVERALGHNRKLLNGGYEMNKVFYSCHALSKYASKLPME
jgi:hypothetical protein